MPWKKLITGLESIVGTPGTDCTVLDSGRLAEIRKLIKSVGFTKMRGRDIADGYLALVPKKDRNGKGVYYTPGRVVEYILDEVMPPPRLNGKKKDPYEPDFVLLEPACGAGYFLLAALKRFRDAYEKAKYKPDEAIRAILEQRLVGVDIDPKALLVALAGLVIESGESLDKAVADDPIRLQLFQADFLDKGWDVSSNDLGDILRSGVPAIVGNPPYVSFYSKRAKYITHVMREYYKSNYIMGRGRINTYCLFIERAFDLLGPSGVLGFIVPNTVLIMKSYEPLRQYLLDNGWLKSIVDLSLKVFPEVEVPTCVLAVEKKDKRALPFPRATSAGFWESAKGLSPENLEETDQESFLSNPYTMFNIHIRSGDRDILDMMEKLGRPLGEIFEVRDGINPANMIDKLVIKSAERLKVPFRRVLRGKDIDRYQLSWDRMWVNYDRELPDEENGEYCFLREERIFRERPKILTRQTADRLIAAYDDKEFYALNTIHVTIPLNGDSMDMKCLLALYNSTLLNYYYRLVFPDTERVFPQVKTVNVEKLPLPPLNGATDRLVALVDRMLANANNGRASMSASEKVLDEIDEVVYSLYEMSPKQVARIERSASERNLKT